MQDFDTGRFLTRRNYLKQHYVPNRKIIDYWCKFIVQPSSFLIGKDFLHHNQWAAHRPSALKSNFISCTADCNLHVQHLKYYFQIQKNNINYYCLNTFIKYTQKEKKKIRLDVRLIDPSLELIEHNELVWLTNLNHTLLN